MNEVRLSRDYLLINNLSRLEVAWNCGVYAQCFVREYSNEHAKVTNWGKDTRNKAVRLNC